MSVRGAERRDARANLSSLRPTTPMRHRAGAHAHHCPSVAWTKYAFEGRRTQPPEPHAARKSVKEELAV